MVQTSCFVYCVLALVSLCQASTISPCKGDDEGCILSTATAMYSKIMAGDPSVGAEVLDPVPIDDIDKRLSILKYKFQNCIVEGYKDCTVASFRVNRNQNNFKLNIRCPEIRLFGNYELDGRLIVLPVQGHGNFSLFTYSYNITLDADYNIVKTEDGKEYMYIKKFDFNALAEKGAKFHFYNLFNGQKDLSDAVHKFANENSLEVLNEFQRPIITITYKKFVKNANKILKSSAMEHLFLD